MTTREAWARLGHSLLMRNGDDLILGCRLCEKNVDVRAMSDDQASAWLLDSSDLLRCTHHSRVVNWFEYRRPTVRELLERIA